MFPYTTELQVVPRSVTAEEVAVEIDEVVAGAIEQGTLTSTMVQLSAEFVAATNLSTDTFADAE